MAVEHRMSDHCRHRPIVCAAMIGATSERPALVRHAIHDTVCASILRQSAERAVTPLSSQVTQRR